MGVSAATADNSTNAKCYEQTVYFAGSVIITMDCQTTGMSAGTSKLVEVNGMNSIIIKILRNSIATIDRYSYHKHMRFGV